VAIKNESANQRRDRPRVEAIPVPDYPIPDGLEILSGSIRVEGIVYVGFD
jgi:hypothetical protein